MTAMRKPAEVFTLAEYLCDEFVARGWKTADVARRFDNGLTQATNLLALNCLMIGGLDIVHVVLIEGLSHALGVSVDFLRAIEKTARDHKDRLVPFVCPLDVLSQEMQDYIA